jgi:hypothetical protein
LKIDATGSVATLKIALAGEESRVEGPISILRFG